MVAAGTGSGLSLPNEDLDDPAIVGTDEDDIVLVYNSSGPSTHPSINYTGRKASDVSQLMDRDQPARDPWGVCVDGGVVGICSVRDLAQLGDARQRLVRQRV